MFEKVSKHHPDKVADRIGGALVDLAYTRAEGGWAKSNPRIAGELTLGHGTALVILETDADITPDDVRQTVQRISGISPDRCHVCIVPQDPILAANQRESEELRVKSEEFLCEQSEQVRAATATHLRCGDNGIFRGSPVTPEQRELTALIKTLDERFHSDAKAVLTPERLTVCQSNASSDAKAVLTPERLTVCQSNASYDEVFGCICDFARHQGYDNSIVGKLTPAQIVINPLGDWTGGLDTDTGAVNRKLGSDMGDSVTGGGIHFKDLSKADVSVNIVAHMLAQQYDTHIEACCSIGDEEVTFDGYYCAKAFNKGLPSLPITMPFADIVERARLYVLTQHGSFEHMAEYGLVS